MIIPDTASPSVLTSLPSRMTLSSLALTRVRASRMAFSGTKSTSSISMTRDTWSTMALCLLHRLATSTASSIILLSRTADTFLGASCLDSAGAASGTGAFSTSFSSRASTSALGISADLSARGAEATVPL